MKNFKKMADPKRVFKTGDNRLSQKRPSVSALVNAF